MYCLYPSQHFTAIVLLGASVYAQQLLQDENSTSSEPQTVCPTDHALSLRKLWNYAKTTTKYPPGTNNTLGGAIGLIAVLVGQTTKTITFSSGCEVVLQHGDEYISRSGTWELLGPLGDGPLPVLDLNHGVSQVALGSGEATHAACMHPTSSDASCVNHILHASPSQFTPADPAWTPHSHSHMDLMNTQAFICIAFWLICWHWHSQVQHGTIPASVMI